MEEKERNHPMGHSGEGASLAPTGPEVAADLGKFDGTPQDITTAQVPVLKWAGLVEDHSFGDNLGHPPTGEKFGEGGASGSLNSWAEAYQRTPKTAILYAEGFGHLFGGTNEKPVKAKWETLTESQRARMGLKPGEKVVNPW